MYLNINGNFTFGIQTNLDEKITANIIFNWFYT